MKRKMICLLMAVVIVMAASGCGKNEENGNNHLGDTGMPGNEAQAGYNQDISVQELKSAVVDVLGENYWPNMEIDSVTLEQYYGIKPDMYEEYVAECPMISVNVDTLIIVKAKEDKVEAVREAMEAYRERNVTENMQYPMNLGKVQASRMEEYDNYVCFVQLGADTTAAMDKGEEAVVNQCLEENERALDAIEKVLLK